MAHQENIETLLDRWKELREQGTEPSAEELCRDHPQLVGELEAKIEQFKATDTICETVKETDKKAKPPTETQDYVGDQEKTPVEETTVGAPRSFPANIGRFRVLERIGEGGFGTVYKAHDAQLDRMVAIKVPRNGRLSGDTERHRFEREARAVAQLRHDSIVSVFEVGEHDQTPYLVTEYVSGSTLSDWLTSNKLTFSDAARLTLQIARALEQAHEKGVIHRDVKPNNIMLDESGTPLLMDFGLAKRDTVDIDVTVEGEVLGTPAYMSPEQASGEVSRVDRRSDIYSLGVALYQLMTGKLPFNGTARRVYHQVLHEQPQAPSRVVPSVPHDLETICQRAMAKDPADRYQTATELADDLERFLNGKPIVARRVGVVRHLMRGMARRWQLTAGVAALVIMACVVFGLVGVFHRQTAPNDTPETPKAPPKVVAAEPSPKETPKVVEQQPPLPKPLPADLAIIPNDAIGFFAIDFVALRLSPGGTKLLRSISEDIGDLDRVFEESVGLQTNEINRVIGFIFRNKKTSVFSEPVVVVTALSPTSVAGLQERVKGNHKITVNGKGIYPSESSFTPAISFLTEQTFVIGEKRDLKDLLSRPPVKKSSWEAALKLAEEKHLVVAGLQPPEVLNQWLQDNLIKNYPSLKPLLNCQQATLAIDLTENTDTQIKLSFDFPSQGAPKENAAALETARQLLAKQIGFFLQHLATSNPQAMKVTQALGAFQNGLQQMDTKIDGNKVRLTMKTGKADILMAGLSDSMMASPVASPVVMASRKGNPVSNSLKQMGLAMHNYADDIGHFPPAAIRDKNGKPLLSWRVAILPYIEQEELYKQFRLDEPWDSPHNIQLLKKMPTIFKGKESRETETAYQVFVGPGTPFEPGKKVTFKNFRFGPINTVLIVETTKPVPWTKPQDIPIGKDRKFPEADSLFPPRIHALMADGSVRVFERTGPGIRKIFVDK